MYTNFFKIVFRNLWRYKGYALINVIGMAIGIAAMVWGYQDYRFARSYDNFHKDQENIYRGITYKKDAEGMKGIFPMAVVQQVKNDFPGIKEAVRLDSRRMNIKCDTSDAFSENVHFTDQSFFNLFNFPLVAGNNNINDRNSVLITEKTAKKYFGNENPIGKVLSFYAGETYAMPLTVRGVLQDVPINSSIQFDFLTNFDNQLKMDGSKIAPDNWAWFLDAAFFRIPDAATASRLEKEMNKYLAIQNKAKEDWQVTGFKLITLKENAELGEVVSANNLRMRPDDSAAYGPFVLAFLIFLSSCLNFSNTTVARANKRLKEIGMRKVMGSTHAQLILQLLMECSIIVIAAILLSVLLNMWWLPAFNQMFQGVKVQADYLHDTNLLVFMFYMLIGTTLLAGAYPAFYVSRFNATTIFRGTVKFGGSNLFSRLMLGLQLSIAIITVIAGVAFARNSAFQRDYDYGYSIDNSIAVPFNDSTSYTALKNEMAAVPEVTALAGTRSHISSSYQKRMSEAEGIKKEIDCFEVGRDYPVTMQLKMVAGRSFDPNMESDYKNALLISQKTAATYGWKDADALGKQIHIDSTIYSVVGVLKDFHSNTLFEPLDPVAMKLVKESRFQYLIIQAQPKDLATVFSKTKEAWKKLYPLKPFDGFYQSQVKAEAYQTSNSIAAIFSWFALLSILLTATGLFALVSLTALKKMKEIALRKVVGASPRHIMVLINKSYFWVFIVAAILGCYGGWALTKLLMDLIFKINAGVGTGSVILSVIVLFIITAVTSGIKVWQAVKTNPVKLLRTE
ncbi:MAG: ABC transporter permease [Ferruginibacter sp.]